MRKWIESHNDLVGGALLTLGVFNFGYLVLIFNELQNELVFLVTLIVVSVGLIISGGYLCFTRKHG